MQRYAKLSQARLRCAVVKLGPNRSRFGRTGLTLSEFPRGPEPVRSGRVCFVSGWMLLLLWFLCPGVFGVFEWTGGSYGLRTHLVNKPLF